MAKLEVPRDFLPDDYKFINIMNLSDGKEHSRRFSNNSFFEITQNRKALKIDQNNQLLYDSYAIFATSLFQIALVCVFLI